MCKMQTSTTGQQNCLQWTKRYVIRLIAVHAFHFTCTTCKITLNSSNCREHETKLYCLRDYERAISMKNTCFGCRKQIRDERSVTGLGKNFHKDCFVCAKCESPFTNDIFFEYEKKAYWYFLSALSSSEYDYNELTGNICGHCFNPAKGGDQCVRALDKKWWLVSVII